MIFSVFLVLKCEFPQALPTFSNSFLNPLIINSCLKVAVSFCNKSILVFLKLSCLPNILFVFRARMGDFIQGPLTYQQPPVYTRSNGFLSFSPSGIPFLINPNTCWQGCKMVVAGGKCGIKKTTKDSEEQPVSLRDDQERILYSDTKQQTNMYAE